MEIKELAQIVDGLDTFLQMPDGLQMLHRTILELAVTGKLTTSSEFSLTDEESQARSAAGLREPVDGELQSGWVVAPFGSLGVLARGRSKHRPRNDPALYSEGSVPLVQTGDVARSRGKVTTYSAQYNELGVSQSRVWPAGTLCITIAANIGATGVLQFPACFPDSVVGYVPNESLVDLRYVEIFLRAIQEDLERDAPSTAQKNINLKVLERTDIMLPSLGEQRAIAEQVATLTRLIDNFEHVRDVASESRRRFSRLALWKLGTTLDATAVENLDEVLMDLQDVRHLATAIFDLALTGHLVEPALAGETTDHLLAQIAAEKSALGIKGEITTQEPDGSIDLPVGWRLVALGDVLFDCRNGTSAKPNDMGIGYPLLRISAATSRSDGIVDLSDHKYVELPEDQAKPNFVRPGDLLVCRFNGNLHYVGRAAQVPAEVPRGTLHPDKLICLRAIVVSHAYLRYVLNSSFVRRQIENVAATTAGNIGINGRQLKAVVVPLAPLAEQERIVKRLDAVFGLLDNLAQLLV